jgi:hypothetical protein
VKIARGLLDGNADGSRCSRGCPAAKWSTSLDEVAVFVEEHPVIHPARGVSADLVLDQSEGGLG